MKRVIKGPAPKELSDYVSSFPDAGWNDVYDDNAHGGYQVAHECRNQALRDQKELCAYCEQKISSRFPLNCRVEHFHPKSDKSGAHNWDTDWKNMLAVCNGGDRSSEDERVFHPLPDNLSCDAHKNHMTQRKKLSENCEG